ncbi:MAG: CoA pyrophosphatase [Deltaproteobacteria bacterium]|nr:CoA pyrophosphatase [Deltaproteobacteria bacterium]
MGEVAAANHELDAIAQALSRHGRLEIPLGVYLPAAVALPLVSGPGGLAVLFTVRTAHVEQHKGEISFPGGRVDAEDADTLAAALRETWEEVGVRPEDLKVLGALDDFVSVTGYRVTPYVVHLERADYPFVAAPMEVAEILLVPLTHVLDPSNYYAIRAGENRTIHHFRWGPYLIWGLTAAVLKHFLELSFGFTALPPLRGGGGVGARP